MARFNPDRTAVVIVDMQNAFCDPDGSLYAPPSNDAIDPVNALVADAREAGAHVVYTRDVHTEDQFEDTHYYDEFDRWGEHVLEGTWDAELVDELTVRDEDFVVEKPTYDAFHETGLHEHLQDEGIDNLVIAGTLANVCVLHTASTAALHDYRPVIVEDAVGYLDETDREYALEHAEWLFGETTPREDIDFTRPSP